MRVAFFADVQGNAAALERVLAEIAAREPDHIVAAGDFVGLGPSPRRVLSLLAGRSIELIRGPGDAVLAIGLAGNPDQIELPSWTTSAARLITSIELAPVSESPDSRTLTLHGRQLWFTHGAASELRALADEHAGEEEVVAAIGRAGLQAAQVIAFGTRATPFVRKIGARTIAATGSVGLMQAGDPCASFSMIHVLPDREIEVELVRVPYPIARAGASLVQDLLATHARDVYLDALGPDEDWTEASMQLIHDIDIAGVRLREALAFAAPLVERVPARRAHRRLKRLARAVERRRALDVAIRDVRAKEEQLGGRADAAALLRALKQAQKDASKRLARKFPRAKMLVHGLELFGLAATDDPTATFQVLARSHLRAQAERMEVLLPALEHPKDEAGQRKLRNAMRSLRATLELVREVYPDAVETCAVRPSLLEVSNALELLRDARKNAKTVRKLERSGVLEGAEVHELLRSLEHEAKARHRAARDLLSEKTAAISTQIRELANAI